MEGASIISVSDFQTVLTTLQSQISVSTVVQVLVVALGASVGFAFMWWGARKLIAALMKGFKKGGVGI